MEDIKAETVVQPDTRTTAPLELPESIKVAAVDESAYGRAETAVGEGLVPDGHVQFEFNPEFKDKWGRAVDRCQIGFGNISREFLAEESPFIIHSQDWRAVQSHAPGVFRECGIVKK